MSFLRSPLRGLFGPMLGYDLVRTGRRSRIIGNRCLYLLGLWLLLYVVFAIWFPNLRSFDTLFDELSISQEQLPRFAESSFVSFFLFQFAAVLIATPAYTAGAIAVEKANGTLDYLLTTHLTSREIVLGMLASRLSHLLLLLLAGLPVLGLLLLLGGIDPNQLIVGYLGLVVTMISLGSVCMLISVHARTELGAMFFTYPWTLIYAACGLFGIAVSFGDTPHILKGMGLNSIWFCLGGYTAINAGVTWISLSLAVRNLRRSASATDTVSQSLDLRVNPRPTTAINQVLLRPSDSSEDAVPDVQEVKPFVVTVTGCRLPPMLENALQWKEFAADHAFFGEPLRLSGAIVLACFALVFLPAALVCPAENKILVAQLPDTIILSIFLFFVALSAAQRLAVEQDRNTLDGLRCTPYESSSILFAKWLGSLLMLRWYYPTLAVIWLISLFTGCLHVLSALLVLVGSGIYLALAASLGLWLAAICRNSLRALAFTAIAAIIMIVGPSLLMRVFINVPLEHRESGISWQPFLDQVFSPVLNLWMINFDSSGVPYLKVLAGLFALSIHAALAYGLWRGALARFDALKGPAPIFKGAR